MTKHSPDSPRAAAAQDTRERVLEAGKALFEKHGYAGTTMKDVAAAVGMSVGAVYASVSDKDSLYVATYGHLPLSPEAGLKFKRRQGADGLYADVRAFHLAFGHPVGEGPTFEPQLAVRRAPWIREEVDELEAAPTVADQADAYIDIIYFAIGGLVEIGVQPGKIWDIVHRANMAKLQPGGTVKRRDDGKVIKPEGWVAPEPLIEAEVVRQQTEASAQ